MYLKSLFLTFLLLIGSACSSIAPTPILMGRVTDLNNDTVALYIACSEGANYVPTKEGCDARLLSLKVDETMSLSLVFISADIKQPQGYDIYLATAMIYFRIGQRNLNEYTKAEQIARQFFEVQKAQSGKSITSARFYWAWYASATSSKQFFEDVFSLTIDRKSELLLAVGEGTSILSEVEGARLIRLKQALDGLNFVINTIE